MIDVLIIARNPMVCTRQMANTDGISSDGRYRFHINDYACKPQIVVVNGKGLRVPTTFAVPKRRTILLTDEPYSVLAYPKGYYGQFGTVVTCQREIKPVAGTRVIYSHVLLPWWVGITWEADHSNRITLTYDDIKKAQPEKTKLISVIYSFKTFSAGHALRRRFVERLQDRWGDRIDVYGKGITPFTDKWDVTAPYKYQLVIENCQATDYFTEKLSDAFLANTYPIYHGCPNAADYYPQAAFTPVDIRNFDQTVATIERVLADNLWEKRQKELAQCKQLALDKYNFFNRLAEVCNEITDEMGENGETLLRPAHNFFSLHNAWLYAFGRSYHNLKSKIKL